MLKILNINGTIIIGKYEVEGDTMRTRNAIIRHPRILMPDQDQNGRPLVRFLELIGAPKEMKIDTVPTWSYNVEDPGVKATYTEAVTGLFVPKNGTGISPLEIVKS